MNEQEEKRLLELLTSKFSLSELKEVITLLDKDQKQYYNEQLNMHIVSRSNRKDTINNFIDIASEVIKNTKINKDKTYTIMSDLVENIVDNYEIIKK